MDSFEKDGNLITTNQHYKLIKEYEEDVYKGSYLKW